MEEEGGGREGREEEGEGSFRASNRGPVSDTRSPTWFADANRQEFTGAPDPRKELGSARIWTPNQEAEAEVPTAWNGVVHVCDHLQTLVSFACCETPQGSCDRQSALPWS